MKTSVKRRAKNCIRGAVLLACFIAVWYVASCFTQPLFIPAPAAVWEAIVGLAETGQLQKGLAYSFLRITGASALSMLVAIPLSLLIYGVKPIKETIMPVVSFSRYVPVTAFSPLLILWFGIGEQMKISFLFIATFVYLLPSILLCFDDVPQDLMDTGKTIGMTSWETIKEILLPAYEGMPEIPMQPVSEPMYAPETPVIDAAQVSYDDVIASIYQQGDIDDENSIFKIKAYIDILPQDMTKAKKQASIAGILSVNGINVDDLIEDGLKRGRVLDTAEDSIRAENDALIAETEADIEHLKSLIEQAEARIEDSKQKTSDSSTAIQKEKEAISQLLEFANGVAGKEGAQ